MAFMALPSDQATMSKHFKGTSSSSGVSSLSQATYSTSLVSDFKDKFSVEGPSSLYTITNGNSPGIQRASSPSPWSSQEYQLQNSEPNSRGCGTQSPELLQTSDWPQMIDTSNMHFVKPGVTMIPTGSTVSHGSPSSTQDSTARMHEILGRLGSNHPCHPSNGAPPPGNSPHAASPQRLSSGPLRNNSWSAMDISNKITASLDTAKGISLQGAGLATSHCLAQFTSDPGFAERAAKFSSFSNGSYSQLSPPYLPEGKGRRLGAQSVDTVDGKLSRSSSSSRLSHLGSSNGSNVGAQNVEAKSPEEMRITEGTEMEHDARSLETHMKNNDQKGNDRLENCSSMEGVEGVTDGRAGSNELDTGDEHENSSCSEQPRGDGGAHGGPVRSDSLGKRKKSPKEKSKENSPTPGGKLRDNEEANAKRCRSSESVQEDLKGKGDRCSSENSGETSPRSTKECLKPPEAPKQDFIHVRARRGQATDSHSLAERVRREKISERMKFLQDLVPGCSKVTGKAVMLEEIINYVQSLQRQVEFLSMKLAAVNPRLEFNVDNFLAKETHLSPPAMMLGPDLSNPYGHHQAPRQAPMQQLGGPSGLDFRPLEGATEASLRRTMSAPVTAPLSCLEVFGEALSQTSSLWDGELQSVVNHMSFLQQGLPTGFLPQGLHCQLPAGHMKVEL